jgi:hypothetical protein
VGLRGTKNRCAAFWAYGLNGSLFMRVFFGMILGAMLTLGLAFVHDNWRSDPTTATTTTTGSASPTTAHRNMVNWDVVDDNWRAFRQRMQATWAALSQKVSG